MLIDRIRQLAVVPQDEEAPLPPLRRHGRLVHAVGGDEQEADAEELAIHLQSAKVIVSF